MLGLPVSQVTSFACSQPTGRGVRRGCGRPGGRGGHVAEGWGCASPIFSPNSATRAEDVDDTENSFGFRPVKVGDSSDSDPVRVSPAGCRIEGLSVAEWGSVSGYVARRYVVPPSASAVASAAPRGRGAWPCRAWRFGAKEDVFEDVGDAALDDEPG